MGTTAADLLADLSRLGIEVVAHGDRLRYRPQSALTPDLVERLRIHKTELLATLRPTVAPGGGLERGGGHPDPTPEPIWGEDCIDPPDPCSGCDGLVFWWNLLGDRRCLNCDPPKTAIRLLERAERIRRRHGIPSPPGAAEMLADLNRLTGT